jgi:hypothetical protein
MDRRPGPDPDSEPPHDILAAEEFALGEADPGLHREPATDVLAAEEFALPAADQHALPPDVADGPSAGGLARPGTTRAPTWLSRGVPLAALLALLLRYRRRR